MPKVPVGPDARAEFAFIARGAKGVTMTMKPKPTLDNDQIVRHYRFLFSDTLACRRFFSSTVEATSVPEGVTCLDCLRWIKGNMQ